MPAGSWKSLVVLARRGKDDPLAALRYRRYAIKLGIHVDKKIPGRLPGG